MNCESPVRIKNPNYTCDHRNGGYRAIIRDFYRETMYIDVPCGKCPACLSNRRKNWFFRLKVEANKCVSSYVVTLTYNEKDVPDYCLYEAPDSGQSFLYHPLFYRDVQLFNKKLRKDLGSFRFFCVGEYGSEFLRPHWHICYFFDHSQPMVEFEDSVFKNWFPDSRITIDVTNDRAANYILKYCLSLIDPKLPDIFRPIIRCSNRPFIGSGLLENDEFLRYLHIKRTDLSSYAGYKSRLPRIFRDRIFSDDERLFFSHEWMKLSDKLAAEKKTRDDEYFCKYGQDRQDWDRISFNQRVLKIAKLKSLQ